MEANKGHYRVKIDVDWNDIKSIRKAERAKTKLENYGYSLKTTYSNLSNCTLVFTK